MKTLITINSSNKTALAAAQIKEYQEKHQLVAQSNDYPSRRLRIDNLVFVMGHALK